MDKFIGKANRLKNSNIVVGIFLIWQAVIVASKCNSYKIGIALFKFSKLMIPPNYTRCQINHICAVCLCLSIRSYIRTYIVTY